MELSHLCNYIDTLYNEQLIYIDCSIRVYSLANIYVDAMYVFLTVA